MTEYSNNNEYEKEYEEDTGKKSSEKGENPLMFMIFLAIVGVFAYLFLMRMQDVRESKSAEVENYILSVRELMFEDFNPVGITKSGRCIVSFEIDPSGNIINQRILQKSGVPILDRKVLNSLKGIRVVEAPPKGFKYEPVKIEFNCVANKMQAECYSKNIVERKNK